MDGPAWVLYDIGSGVPAVGDEWGSVADSFNAGLDKAGLLVLGTGDTTPVSMEPIAETDPPGNNDVVFVEIARPSQYKPKIHFKLSTALTTASASATAEITHEWGYGYPSPNSGAGEITVMNMPNSDQAYTFEGDIGHCGVATLSTGSVYIVDNLECP